MTLLRVAAGALAAGLLFCPARTRFCGDGKIDDSAPGAEGGILEEINETPLIRGRRRRSGFACPATHRPGAPNLTEIRLIERRNEVVLEHLPKGFFHGAAVEERVAGLLFCPTGTLFGFPVPEKTNLSNGSTVGVAGRGGRALCGQQRAVTV